jgi:hypothetical protein
MPVKDKNGVTIAVIQALNKHAAQTASQSLNTGEWDTSERANIHRTDLGPPPTPSQLPHIVPGTPQGGNSNDGRGSGRMFNFSNAASSTSSIGSTSSTTSSTSASGGSAPGASPLPPRATSPLIPFAAAPPTSWDNKRASGDQRAISQAVATIINGSGGDDEKKNLVRLEDVVPFNQEDEEILEAFCVEVRAIIRRYQTEAMIEMSQFKMNDSVYSLMDMHSGGNIGSLTGSNAARVGLTGLTRGRFMERSAARAAVSQQTFVWPIDSKSSKLGELNDLEFNVWTKSPDDLLVYSYQIFEEMNLLNEFQIPVDTLKNFFLQVRSKYHDNPFHNWYILFI